MRFDNFSFLLLYNTCRIYGVNVGKLTKFKIVLHKRLKKIIIKYNVIKLLNTETYSQLGSYFVFGQYRRATLFYITAIVSLIVCGVWRHVSKFEKRW